MRYWIIIFTLAFLLSACGQLQGSALVHESAPTSTAQASGALQTAATKPQALENRASAPSANNLITLHDGASTFSGTGGVSIAGEIITITTAGTYTLVGSLSQGQIVVNAAGKGAVNLVLNGVSITHSTSAALLVEQAEETVITLADGTQNSLTSGADASATEENAIKACLFSSDDLWLCGAGSLQLFASKGNGIQSKDTLTLASGNYSIEAASNGVVGKDSLTLGQATLNVVAENDGIKATNADDTALGWVNILGGSYHIVAGGDALQAETALTVWDGSFQLTTGGGAASAPAHTENQDFGRGTMGAKPSAPIAGEAPPELPESAGTSSAQNDANASYKGIKASTLAIHGGTFVLNTCDDALHSNGDLLVSGGSFSIATGDDALHADATLQISGGTLTITESYEGLEAYTLEISGGDIALTASDDGINAAGGDGSGQYGFAKDSLAQGTSTGPRLQISGGRIVIDAQGDGIDVNGSAEINGGTITVHGPENGGNSALDYDGSFLVNGGTLLCLGSAQMSTSPSKDSAQPVISVYESISAGQIITLQDAQGAVLLEETALKSSQHLILCTDAVAIGSAVTVLLEGNAVGKITLTAGINILGDAGAVGGGSARGNGSQRDGATTGEAPTQSA